MDAQCVLTASVLDIIFDGRNKDYGAYTLRKEYPNRLLIALASTAFLVGLLLLFYYSGSESAIKRNASVITQVLEMATIKYVPVETPKIIPHRPVAQPKIKTVKFAGPPIIVKNELPDETPPENSVIENTTIGIITQEGTTDDIMPPPLGVSDAIGSINKPDADVEKNKTFIKVETESAYPGGPAAWARFLNKTLRYPAEAQDNRIQGPVIAQFIVDTLGAVSHVEVISGPEELKEEAIRVIKRSGCWRPAIQNGRKVRSLKTQPITFRLMDQ